MLSLSHHSPSGMKKHLDQTEISCLTPAPAFSKNRCNDLWKRCGNDGVRRVALHTRRGLCQHRVVHEVDGLHVAGWLVYLIVTAARYKVSFLPLLFRKPANLRPLHQLLQQCSLSVRGPVFNPLWLEMPIHSTVLLKQSNTPQALCPPTHPPWSSSEELKSAGTYTARRTPTIRVNFRPLAWPLWRQQW